MLFQTGSKAGTLRSQSSVIVSELNGPELAEHERKQYAGVLEEVNSDSSISSNASANAISTMTQQMALSFLQLCFGSHGYEVVPEDSLEHPKKFLDLFDSINEELNSLITEKDKLLARNTKQLDELEAEFFKPTH